MAAVARQTAEPEKVKPKPKMPAGARYLWEWWCELDHARGSSGFGVNPVSFTEIASWSSQMDIHLEPWEARAIRAIDDAYVQRMHSE